MSLLTAAAPPVPVGLVPQRFATAAMGTRFELVLGTLEPAVRSRAIGEAVLEIILDGHRRLSRFAPDSLVSHINRCAHAQPVRLDRDTFALFVDALAVHRQSGGAFDIAFAGGRGCSRAVELDAGTQTIRLARADAALDLGAIAKGHALDLAVRLLREHDVTCALLHGGTSSVAAIGTPPGSTGWRVALGGPGGRTVELRDAALSVSGPAGPGSVDGRGTRPPHIVDPRSGTAVDDRALTAVVGPSARLADAWSTAIAVLGEVPPTLGPAWTTYRVVAP